MADAFWQVIREQLAELKDAKSADDVIGVLSIERNPYRLNDPSWTGASGDGFFAGSGGDDSVWDVLDDLGWKTLWSEASYYWAMEAPDGSQLTYIEGDIYRGDRR